MVTILVIATSVPRDLRRRLDGLPSYDVLHWATHYVGDPSAKLSIHTDCMNLRRGPMAFSYKYTPDTELTRDGSTNQLKISNVVNNYARQYRYTDHNGKEQPGLKSKLRIQFNS